ncbi:MAG: sugar ABC transporter ATP-binding protein [Bacteroidales bacterium]|nr:sugar ABC transporter ATP-binding protein [Bacteroidales bacterium]
MAASNNIEQPLLEARNVSKDFSGVYALKNVEMKIYEGKVNAIIGENGAGKSTLMKIISGIHSEYEGEVMLDGLQIQFKSPGEAKKSGVNIIHQELNLVPHLTITENIFLGHELTNRLGLLDYPEMNKKTKGLLTRLELNVPPTTPVYQLRVGQQQLVEIAKSLLFESKVLIMDEPTSAISDHEVELLFRIINNLKNKGVAIVYVSHKLDELFEIADNYNVLRDGAFISSGSMKETSKDKLIRMMVGRDLDENARSNVEIGDEELLRVENLCLQNPENREDYLVNNVSFSLRKGEILGISGLMGAGRTEVLEAIFGLFPTYVSGEVFVEGEKINIRSIKDAISAGIALVPEDRKLQGLILNMNVAKNTSLASLKRISRFSFINRKKETELSRYYIERLKTQVSSGSLEVEKLSGGNQQKVVISKWLATHPKILLLDEPTRGIDVGAKGDIYTLMKELAAAGMGIIFVSSELPEILSIADNILVLSESKLTAELTRDEASEEVIMKAAIAEKV